jgi:hypothetical protein
MKMAQKDGIQPNIEGLAKLSDQYLALKPGVERTQFLLDKFGKSGMEMGKLMEKGGAGIREMSDAVDENLIMTQKGIDAADNYQEALDNWNDSIQAVKISIGNELLPVMTDLLDHTSLNSRALEIMEEQGLSTYHAMGTVGYAAAYKLAAQELELSRNTEEATAAQEDNTAAQEEGADAAKALTDAEKDLSEAYRDRLDSIFDIQDAQDDFKGKTLDLAAELQEAQQRLTEAKHEYGFGSEQANEAQANIDEVIAKQGELTADFEKNKAERMYALLEEKVMQDGILDEIDKSFLQSYALREGLISKQAVQQARDEEVLADAVLRGAGIVVETTADKIQKVKETQEAVQSAAQVEVSAMNSVTNATIQEINAQGMLQYAVSTTAGGYNNLSSAAMAAYSATPSSTFSSPPVMQGSSTHRTSRDSGGPGFAGQEYLIGTGAQPEMFVPSTNGTFIPNADKIGATYNIVINNPIPERAADSTRKALKSLSYAGEVQ